MTIRFYLGLGYFFCSFLMSFLRNKIINDRKDMNDFSFEICLTLYAALFGIWLALTYVLVQYFKDIFMILGGSFVGMFVAWIWSALSKKMTDNKKE